MSEQPLRGKNALVTGAAKRIGREVALTLASQGANIALHYRNAENEARDLCIEIERYGSECWLFQADFERRDGYEGLIEAVFDKSGGVDVLVNSASIFPQSTLHDITWENLAAVMQINTWAPFYLCRSFAKKAKQGVIVNLLDARSGGIDPRHVAYLLSKQALETLTRFMALEFAPDIRVNGVAPGLILPPPGEDERYLERLINTVPLRRHGNEGNIADAVLFLIRNDFITGQVIYIDGGRSIAR
jgi:pteridine reductase